MVVENMSVFHWNYWALCFVVWRARVFCFLLSHCFVAIEAFLFLCIIQFEIQKVTMFMWSCLWHRAPCCMCVLAFQMHTFFHSILHINYVWSVVVFMFFRSVYSEFFSCFRSFTNFQPYTTKFSSIKIPNGIFSFPRIEIIQSKWSYYTNKTLHSN